MGTTGGDGTTGRGARAAAERRRATPLEAEIRARIAETGGLSVADYMTLCLTHPRHGYYTTRQPLGAAGDFITAPEASQIFGELIGAWVAAGWRAMGAPALLRLVEPGPGRGLLMADLLRAAAHMPGFAEAVRVHLVEASPLLRAEQKRRLAGRAPVRWHADLAEVPEGPTIVVANEFLDALPVHHHERTPEGWRERLVVVGDDGELTFAACGAPLREVPEWAAALPPGSVIETGPARDALAAEVAARVARHGGAALFIDYGHARPGPGETLQAVHRHRQVPVFFRPGEADLTAHVDFNSLAAAMRAAGCDVHGPMAQGDFLRALGLEARLAVLMQRADARRRMILRRGARRIAGDDQMGRLFKVLAAVPRGAPAPPPFHGEGAWRSS